MLDLDLLEHLGAEILSWCKTSLLYAMPVLEKEMFFRVP